MTIISESVRTLIKDFRSSTQDVEVATTPPAETYVSEEFFAFEQDALFAREWNCVARVEDLPNPGDFITTDIAGEPVIVVRNRDGEINAMSAVCRHRAACITAPAGRDLEDLGAPLGDITGHVESFQCPYHWWVYDLEGQLVAAPEMGRTKDFAVKGIRLPRFKTEIWHGFVFVNLDPEARPLAPQLAQIEDAVKTYQVSTLKSVAPDDFPGVPFNWKILVENFLDGYHASRLHAGLHDFAPSSSIEEIPFDEDAAVVSGWTRNTIIDGAFNPSFKVIMPVIAGLPEEYRRSSFFAALVPNLMIIGQPDMVMAFQVRPTSARSHDLRLYYMVPEETTKLGNFMERLELSKVGFVPITEQDMGTNISVQKGLESRFFTRGRYSYQEGMVNNFNKMLGLRYEAALRTAG
ncbi:aromatic ring-hydroxylating oxygenase subunit alpha [Geodermatophilus ruber]|uniref:Phenylpropionate dioxygenase, large terminal subunit n=1 Tax=Geodermatophilus ruber TaxID=504800 RepID=A0A1I4E223_9ACTN|nr:aromatic ring-hydroxylating dioxygenase subunit alpha [Geodermatophilus ruber]SFK98386.1 Phenylpropionate dioxygenase, large terminal subunit [Geodermatophilus ruber]